MRICRFSMLLLLTLVMVASGLMASGFENSGIGIRARGMGGAFRAVANDWTAAYYNPAGYAYIQDNQLGANLALVHHRNELNPNYTWPGGSGWEQQGVFNGYTIYNFHQVLSNPSVGFVVRLPIWGETVFGLSGYQPFDNNITWELYDHNDAYNNILTVPGAQFRNNLDVVAFQFTAAREFVEEKLSIGIGLQLLRADLLFNNLVFRDNPFWDEMQELNMNPDEIYRKIPQFNQRDGNGWGFGFRSGLLWNYSEKVNLAVTANIPFGISLSGESVQEYHLPNIPLISPNSIEFANRGNPQNLFVTGARVFDSSSFETDLDLPPSLGLGLAYQFSDRLLIAVDAEYTFWSVYDGLDFKLSNHHGLVTEADTSDLVNSFMTADASVPADWKNAGKFMVGALYNFSPLLTFLGGISADQSPARESSHLTPQFIDTGDKYGFNAGVIFNIQQWELGLVSSYTSFPDLRVESIVDLNNDGVMDRFAGDYKAGTYETIISFNYRF